MIKIELKREEADALTHLLDLATKAGGIRVAGAAAAIMQKIVEATKASRETN